MTTVDELFRETLCLRIAFGDLVGRVCVRGTNASDVPLDTVVAGLAEFGLDRFGALLYANRVADSIGEGRGIAEEVGDWLAAGRRPRTMYEAAGPDARARIEEAFRRAEEGSCANAR